MPIPSKVFSPVRELAPFGLGSPGTIPVRPFQRWLLSGLLLPILVTLSA